MLLGARYKLLSAPLSTGSFGSVFVADDQRMPRRVAVKILHPQHAANPTVRARFRRELDAACRVSHENVVAVFDIGEDPNLGLYYVMELVNGTALKDYLNGEPLPWPLIYRVASQLARALHAIHAAGIVHRDLKPQNIMMVERSGMDEQVKVLDFGIASLKTPEEEQRDVELTGARMVLGTPPYMSPEQTYMKSDRERLGVEVDARSDIYSMGVILYEMTAGRRPFSGDAHEIVVAHRLTKPMPLERMVGLNVPREFADLVMRCLAKDPKERPQSAKDCLAAIKECELKPLPDWSQEEGAAVDQHDVPTLDEVRALPIEVLPADTQPRLALDEPRTRSLWGPLVGLGAGAIAAVIAFFAADPAATLGQTPTITEASPAPVMQEAPPAAPAAMNIRTHAGDKAAVSDERVGAGKVPTSAAGHAGGAPSTLEATAPEDHRDQPGEAAASTKVAFMVTTQPPGAKVVVDGEVVGLTPMNLSYDARQERRLELVLKKDNYQDLPVMLSIGPELSGQALVINHVLTRKKGPSGGDPFKDL